MSVNNATPSNRQDQPTGRPDETARPQLPVTQSEAVRSGLVKSKAIYRLVTLFWEIVVRHYLASGIPRREWEPMPSVVQRLSAPFVRAGEKILLARLHQKADPEIDEADQHVEETRAGLETLEKGTEDVESPETRQRMSATTAVDHVNATITKVKRDLRTGARHHRRVSRVLFWAAKAAPFIEALGLMVFCSYSYNVPWLAPWVAPLPWSVCLTVVLALTFSLKFFTEHSGAAHNHAREAAFEGNKHEAERARTARLGWGIVAAVIALAITAAMIERAVVAMNGDGPLVTAVLLLLAALAGITCPVVTWMAVASDGSTASREVDALAMQLDQSLAVHADMVATVEEQIAAFEQIAGAVVDRTFPEIVDEVQKTVNGARAVHGFLRLQLQLPDASPPPGKLKLVRSQSGPVSGAITSGLPGADEVSLQPLLDRYVHLMHQRDQIVRLTDRLAVVGPHPWDHGAVEVAAWQIE